MDSARVAFHIVIGESKNLGINYTPRNGIFARGCFLYDIKLLRCLYASKYL